AKYGDGWMTTGKLPGEVRESWVLIRECAREEGRALPPDFPIAVYHNVNVQDSREEAFRESKHYLDTYYAADFSADFLERRVALGPPAECVAHLRRLLDAGVTDLTLRLTGYDQRAQFRRVTEDVLPLLV